MEILFIAYVIIGLVHANSKVNNPNPVLRPLWTSDRSLPVLNRVLGFMLIATIWPISMLRK